MMNIGEFARLAGVSTRMLRHYDALGLLVPAHVDPFNGRRSYDVAQLPVLNQLLALKGLGFSLDEVGALCIAGLSAPAADASRESTGAVVQALFEQVIDRMEAAGADRTTPVARYQPSSDQPTVQVTAGYVVPAGSVPDLKSYTLAATEVASLLHRGPMNAISAAYQALTAWAANSAPTWREHYLEAPGEDQAEWLVEVQLELS